MSHDTVILDPVGYFEDRFGLTLKHVSADEWAGACPECGGDDRLRFWTEGNGRFWCRQCGYKGFCDQFERSDAPALSPEERRLRKMEAEIARQKRRMDALEKRQTALEKMMKCKDYLEYYDMVDLVREYWHGEGFTDGTIDEYKLGFCSKCPGDAQGRPSYTIPIFDSSWTKLYNIRHRIVGAEGGDKYRPHMPGLGRFLFNARWTLEHKEILLVEGEKKSIKLSQDVMPTIGIPGANGFDMKWLDKMEKVRRLYVGLDPDKQGLARDLAKKIHAAKPFWDVRMVEFIDKPDDMLTKGWVTVETFKRYLSLAKVV